MFFGDPWFRGIDLATGPDGSVFVLDWSDTGECHNSTGVSRTSGRIYKITYEAGAKTPPSGWDVSHLSPLELAKLHRSANDWYARQASQLLQAKALQGEDVSAAVGSLAKELDQGKNGPLRLRALWTLRLTGGCGRCEAPGAVARR